MAGTDILLVEDDEVLCEIIERNLSARGHSVSVAPDMQSALEALRSRHFDLVMLDINLPDHTGWEMLRAALHEGTLHPDELDGNRLPVVVLSAVQVNPRRLEEFHPLAYLPKPFPLGSLLRLAAEAARRKHGGEVSEPEGDETLSEEEDPNKEEDLYA
jgi:DNA-binding response OmpR family regulator